jgi:nucleoid-associated protein YgaU/DNA-binding SARP family transcriptional activator
MRPIKHLIIGLGALTLIVGFAFGVPAALITYVGWPLPTTIPSVDDIQLALRGGIDPQLVINTLAVIVWIVWAQLVVALAIETTAAVRGRTAGRVPVLPGLQPAVAQLVAAITLAVATLGPLRSAPAVATPLAVEISPAPSYPLVDQDREPHPHNVSQAEREQPNVSAPTFRVGRHDTLWSIAEATLGDGRRWNEIRTVNTGRTMTDGRLFTDTTETLRQGWILVLPTDATVAGDRGPTTETAGEVTVTRGDNFWKIAQATLTSAWGRPPSDDETAPYWRQLVAANRDRLAPPYDPDLIYPGQRFELPPVPTDPQIAPTATTNPEADVGAGEITVQPGDSFWSIAESAIADAWDRTPTSAETIPYWKALVDGNRDRLDPPQDPNLIYPGQVFDLPTIPDDPTSPIEPEAEAEVETPSLEPSSPPSESSQTTPTTIPQPLPNIVPTPPAETPAAPQTAETPTQDGATVSTTQTADADESADDAGLGGELFPIVSRLAGLGVLAAGLVALLRRLRNTQLRHRAAGTIPTSPPPDTASTEAMIRTAAAPTATEFIDAALRAMARDVLAAHIPPPQVVGAHLSTEKLRLLLWTPHTNPPPGWEIDDEGRSWTLPTSTNIQRLRDKANGVPAPYPALTSVGHEDHAQLFLDLEFLGAAQITGDPHDVVATCYTMATELAATPLADDVQIFCVGFGADLAELERVAVVDHLGEVLPALEAKAAAITRTDATSPLQGRLSPANGGTWDPIVVLHPTAEAPDETRRLLTIAHAGKSVAALVGYPTGDQWRLHVADGTVRVEPLGLSFARRNLTPDEQTAVADLVAAAKDLEGTPTELTTDAFAIVEEGIEVPEPAEQTLFVEHRHVEPIPEQVPEMKVLGTLRVDGVERRFPLRKCTELVAYLTFHRGGVEADTLMEALWPEQPPDNERLNRHTSRARVTLGPGPDGQPYVPYITDGIYRISPHLRSDIERFTNHIRQADQTTGADQVRHLQAALELVEGTPFTGAGNAYTWAHTDGLITHTIVSIDNAAHRLAHHALDHGDTEQATWAARKGLLATGACEACYRNLMRAAAIEGNQVAFEATYRELLAVIDADEGPDASSYLDPETTELYEQESRRRRRHAG